MQELHSVITKIELFYDKYRFLSNFYPSTIRVGGQLYSTVEHAYQAAKTLDSVEKELIRKAPSPGDAKRLGRKVSIQDGWNEMRIDIMTELISQKFENPFLCDMLINTGNLEIIHVNNWNDTFFGVCRGKGENWLGKILMLERNKINKMLENEPKDI